ncbi:Uncharacterized protein FKW44_018707 [Caligus rogercresseyi]|uniref:Uncharacterized protein n=1 Tax=Caligus rogercresseyi TaxID=217165 RepID=A0A7T8JXM8_CALRO|nr:Uncharacterized protein FKW44_018707 [Caligus rogercresseyi]
MTGLSPLKMLMRTSQQLHYQASSLSHVSGLFGIIRGHNAIDLVSPRGSLEYSHVH